MERRSGSILSNARFTPADTRFVLPDAKFIELRRLLNNARSNMRQARKSLNHISRFIRNTGSNNSKNINRVRKPRSPTAKDRHQSTIDKHEHALWTYDESVAEFDYRKQRFEHFVICSYGVPECYRDNIEIRIKPDGATHVSFGGKNGPYGEGHGHYVIDKYGIMLHRREQGEPHGRRNKSSRQNNMSLAPALVPVIR